MTGKPWRWVACLFAGALASAIPLGLYLLRNNHHYAEVGTFFRGAVGDQQVVGIAFIEFDGWGCIELTQWKVQMVSRSGERMTVYQKSSVFQEKVPHQPKIETDANRVLIDDGEDQITVDLRPAKGS